ncbi:MAG: hypothetical protein Q7J16_12955 [Candidatus Cloacimonadales bacterium]|nr:hypothetical protein [Candidatus Cloacimonadales bacterium]
MKEALTGFIILFLPLNRGIEGVEVVAKLKARMQETFAKFIKEKLKELLGK